MASLVNKYFHVDKNNEQTLLNSLVKESIKIQGRTYYYLPRDTQVRDMILGEDVISAFSLAIPIEMYMIDAQGFQGQKEMFSKFGLQIQNSYKLVVAVDRWDKEIRTQFDSAANNGETPPPFIIDNYIRPREGDLIFDTLTSFLMVVNFVDHDMEFYSLGKNYAYYLSCEAFLYQNEKINTDVPAIDSFNMLSLDNLDFQITIEPDGGSLLLDEIGGNYILQEESPNPTEPQRFANIDFSTPASLVNAKVSNPFAS